MITNWAFQKKTFSKSFPLIISLIEFESWLGFATRAANCSWGNTFTQQSGILQFKPACNLGNICWCDSESNAYRLLSGQGTFLLFKTRKRRIVKFWGGNIHSHRQIFGFTEVNFVSGFTFAAAILICWRFLCQLWPFVCPIVATKTFYFFLLTDLNFLFPCSTISWSTTSKNIRKKQSKFTTPRFWESRNFESSTTALHHGYCKWKSRLDPVKFGF